MGSEEGARKKGNGWKRGNEWVGVVGVWFVGWWHSRHGDVMRLVTVVCMSFRKQTNATESFTRKIPIPVVISGTIVNQYHPHCYAILNCKNPQLLYFEGISRLATPYKNKHGIRYINTRPPIPTGNSTPTSPVQPDGFHSTPHPPPTPAH